MQNAISVSFNNQTITAFMNNGEPVIAMKPIVENMGLAWSGQFEKIKRHPVLSASVRVIRMVAEDGKQREMQCLPLKMLNGWLFGIDSNRVKAEIKDSVIAYQEKCFDVLADYFGMTQKPQTTQAPKALPDYRTKLNKAVKNWVAVAKKNGSNMGYDDAWRIVHLKTGMLDGVELATQEQIEHALIVVGDAMHGEFIAKTSAPIEPPKLEAPTAQPISVNLYPMIDYTFQRTESWHDNFEAGQHAVNNLVAGMMTGNAIAIDRTFQEIKRNQLAMMKVDFCSCGASVGYLSMVARYALIGMQESQKPLMVTRI